MGQLNVVISFINTVEIDSSCSSVLVSLVPDPLHMESGSVHEMIALVVVSRPEPTYAKWAMGMKVCSCGVDCNI